MFESNNAAGSLRATEISLGDFLNLELNALGLGQHLGEIMGDDQLIEESTGFFADRLLRRTSAAFGKSTAFCVASVMSCRAARI
jgi:hypothetical protein